MNQGALDVVRQETARVNTYILEISELKWTGRGEFSSDDDYVYYCGQESLRRNGRALRVNKGKKCSTWVQSQQRQNDLGSFPRQPFFFYANNFSSLWNYFSFDNLPSPTIICMPRNNIFFIKYYKPIHFSLHSESLHSLLRAKHCHAPSRKHKDDLDSDLNLSLLVKKHSRYREYKYVSVENLGLGPRLIIGITVSQYWVSSCLIVWPWTCNLISLNLSFFIWYQLRST